MAEQIIATYALGLTPGDDLGKKAQAIALGQTVGSWTPVAQANPQTWELHRAEVIETIPQKDGVTGIVRIAFPAANCEGDLATLLVMLFGKISLDGHIKLMDITLPPSIRAQLPGPRIGIEGIRQQLNATNRPLSMAIFKPCLGLTPAQLAAMFTALALGGLDLVKDDEILPDLPAAPTAERVIACQHAAARVKSETGRTVLYAVNLTGQPHTLRERALHLQSLGASCFLFNVLAYGWSAFQALTTDPEIRIPFMAHPALAGGYCGSPTRGFSYPLLLGALMRWAGADIVLYPAHYGTFPFPVEDEHGIRDALRHEDPTHHLKRAWPGPSVGIHPGMVPRVLGDYGYDVIINAGSGIVGHPDGPEAGARAMRQAIELATAGQTFSTPLPAGFPELETAIQTWGTA